MIQWTKLLFLLALSGPFAILLIAEHAFQDPADGFVFAGQIFSLMVLAALLNYGQLITSKKELEKAHSYIRDREERIERIIEEGDKIIDKLSDKLYGEDNEEVIYFREHLKKVGILRKDE